MLQFAVHHSRRIETQRWAFEVYLRKGRLLLALSAVQRALATAGAADPTAHCLVVRFALAAQQAQQQPTNGQARLFPVCKTTCVNAFASFRTAACIIR